MADNIIDPSRLADYRPGMMLVLDGLASVADRYEVLFCDVWGVIHNGRESFAGPCRALSKWREMRGPVILVSNSPRPSSDVVLQLDGLGVPREAWSGLVTSGDATRSLLAERTPGPAFLIGPERDAPLYEGLGLSFSPIDLATFISCTGPNDDENEIPEDYREALSVGVERRLDFICANPDIVVQRGEKLIYCGGALAELYNSLGGRVLMAGKPYRPIYDLSLGKAQEIAKRSIMPREVLAIGDGISTDLVGAKNMSMDSLFIASGIHVDYLSRISGKFDLSAAIEKLEIESVMPNFIMHSLSW